MREVSDIPPDHPRAESLRIRERLIEYFRRGVVARAGLIAHGRGEAFDYLLGEKTPSYASKAVEAAAAAMLQAKHPVISVNGNVAALVAEEVVRLAEATRAKLEVNLFYRSRRREELIAQVLREAGAEEILGIGEDLVRIPEVHSERRRVDPEGILIADLVLLALEDGDRTEALHRMGKKVIVIDLNPLSRSSQWGTITIVDNIVRAAPSLVEEAVRLSSMSSEDWTEITDKFDNRKALQESIGLILRRLTKLSERSPFVERVT